MDFCNPARGHVVNRYARQISLPEIGRQGQQRLASSRVLVAGAGGLGANLLPLLSGAGIGQIRLYDPDCIEETNLHRQTLFRTGDIGRPKAVVAAETLTLLNPDCQVVPLVTRLDPYAARMEVPSADIVIDAADSFAVSYSLSDQCRKTGRPLISASVLGRRGYAGGFCAGAPSLRAVFPDPPGQLENCNTQGVMGPAVAILGAFQAQMALSVLLGFDPSPLGQMLSFDLADWRMSGFRFDDAAEPEVAGPEVISSSDIRPGDIVIDLRQVDAARFSPDPDPSRRVVFVCNTGLRAWRAARALKAVGHDRVAIIGDGDG
ncbi:MAG: ThiF family adenylyltransferase [Paracoccus sp. (in: a-proteobacteria)]